MGGAFGAGGGVGVRRSGEVRAAASAAACRRAFRRKSAMEDERHRAASSANPAYGGHSTAAAAAAYCWEGIEIAKFYCKKILLNILVVEFKLTKLNDILSYLKSSCY